ncbi:hypothetical protein GA0115251_12559 [Streptomyces sp. TverLS-915]|uniref:DUF2087 domain-containing protein n=1 Tax=Streptomyces sp. TverLS-915 TaxID=1839763 RepID=UPI00081DF95E|nr:DUF2087 domain-containing protein [Streptomyces sp. TverLS-915]SCD83124.1 hypothetical protein GA0115251_12559 [Streptomyces sp. TverLS-915]
METHPALEALADPARLRLFARLVLGERIENAPRAQLVPLLHAGLVRRDGDGTLRARPSAFRTPGAEASGRLPAWVPPHLAGHFRAGRLGSVPAKQRTRAELLTRLAEAEFRPGRAYTEDEVSETLARYTGDPSALRRYCVEYRVLTRERDGSGYRLGEAGTRAAYASSVA